MAVIDGGIYGTHPDLAANIDAAHSTSFVPGQAWNTDTGTFWHGTHVAGIIAALDNATGVVGIAPDATIVGVKALHNGSGDFGWVISAILYAATPIAQGGGGADIINMSLGAVFAKNEEGAGPLVAALNKAVNYADRFGVLVVSAAGNEAIDLDHSGNLISVPAQSGSGIAVAATGPVGWAYDGNAADFSRLASYSNYGTSAIHVSAPGGDFAYPGEEMCTLTTALGTQLASTVLGVRHGPQHEPRRLLLGCRDQHGGARDRGCCRSHQGFPRGHLPRRAEGPPGADGRRRLQARRGSLLGQGLRERRHGLQRSLSARFGPFGGRLRPPPFSSGLARDGACAAGSGALPAGRALA